ncbi:hypothetical protein PILCRDRAFT_85398 [Piloderma croceum F 1598]|uniref:Uncharacterized protein n=1 Tax=Piloderma croceum (strain F 1598) TaxID=765440 RepID=A0A0C3GEA5_PILCF|nr:hypothetical protein PILCRDRAFT_85398 [Piloderma croceum F 1598]
MQLEIPGSMSLFNDRKGIKVAVSFQPILPPLKPGEKWHKNVKAKVINHIIYIHEEKSLLEFLDTVIDDIDKASNLTFSIANQSGLLDTNSFTLEYTINHSNSKDIPIQYIADYKTLIDKIMTLNHMASLFELLIMEQKLRGEDDNEASKDEDEGKRRKLDQPQRRLSKMKTLRGLHGYTLAKIEAVLTQSAIQHLLMASIYISPISI